MGFSINTVAERVNDRAKDLGDQLKCIVRIQKSDGKQ
jgi:hypothetical protein